MRARCGTLARVRIDLHCHSSHSDGSATPEEIGRRALRRGIELFCLTDHDTCAGTGAVQRILGADRALRGVELSCMHRGRTVHLLVYDVARDRRWEVVETALAEQHLARRTRLRQMAARLAELGVAVDADAILAAAGDRSVGRPDLARAMVESGAAANLAEAYQRYLGDGRPADVALHRLDIDEGLELGRRVGARMALAHPHTLGSAARDLLRTRRGDGLRGIEAFYGLYGARERNEWLVAAAELDLVVTAGSDFHGQNLPQVRQLGIDLPEPYAARLCEWLGVSAPR